MRTAVRQPAGRQNQASIPFGQVDGRLISWSGRQQLDEFMVAEPGDFVHRTTKIFLRII
jgi:hypothetical protein